MLGGLVEWAFSHLGFKVVIVGLLWLFWALSALFRRLKEAAKRHFEGEPDVFDEYRPKLPKGWEEGK